MGVTVVDRATGAGSREMPTWLTLLLATAAGLIAANMYYAQPLVGPISHVLGLSPGAAGLIVTATQVGYGLGLLLLVPLGDLIENRLLALLTTAVAGAGLAVAGLSNHAGAFLAASCLIGLGSSAIQVIVPYAAHLTPEHHRGQVVGNVMSGLMLGIMLARPVSSFVTAAFGWHVIFLASAAVMAVLLVVMRLAMPRRVPPPGLRYGPLLASMAVLLVRTPVLQRRAAYHTCLFGAFSLFWTVVPLVLARTFHLSQTGIALFALAGVAGAVAAPVTGRLADRGVDAGAAVAGMMAVAVSFGMWHVGREGSTLALASLVLAGILLDAGVAAHLVVSQRALFSLGAEMRGRLNGLFMAIFFLGGAAGSALGTLAYARGGWEAASLAGLALPLLALGMFAAGLRGRAGKAA